MNEGGEAISSWDGGVATRLGSQCCDSLLGSHRWEFRDLPHRWCCS